VQFRDEAGTVSTPDGALIVERGRRQWRALVEVKTGGADLDSEQVDRYLDIAREHGFDCLVTISNQITANPSEHPAAVDGRKLRRVSLYHLSWWRIVTEAVLQHRFRGIADPDQAWILGELIAYLDHENAGAGGFQDMGERWVRVREAARLGTLRPSDPEVRVIAERWEHFLEYLALGLAQDLGRDVTPTRRRTESTSQRVERLMAQLATNGQLAGALTVPDAAGALELLADLRARQVVSSVRIDAPREGRALTRINWLLRQLSDAPPTTRLEARFANTRETASVLLEEAQEKPQRLLYASDPRREPRSFVVAVTRPMGLKRGKAQGSFVRETRRQVLDFYAEIVQDLKPWQAKAPQLASATSPVPATAQPDPPPFSAVDDRDLGEGVDPATVPSTIESTTTPG